MRKILIFSFVLLFFSCKSEIETNNRHKALDFSKNALDYTITPSHITDKNGLMYSDQGAWFAYSFPDSIPFYGGFSGPFLLTQDNGVWLSTSSLQLQIEDEKGQNLPFPKPKTTSYSSYLKQQHEFSSLTINQTLVYQTGNTARIQSEIKNTSDQDIQISVSFKGHPAYAKGLSFSATDQQISIHSNHTNAKGYQILPYPIQEFDSISGAYQTKKEVIKIKPNETYKIEAQQLFIFPEYSYQNEINLVKELSFEALLDSRNREKEEELNRLITQKSMHYADKIYSEVLAKAHLTLQNNWRIPSGEIKHEGLFPSYHYKWFNGFWSWDSWKHAVGLSYYHPQLAQKQIKLMFEFQDEDGFVADCVYRDNRIEDHNYRDTKPPLSAWAVQAVFEKDQDTSFVNYMYPKIKKYHNWWYQKRDHDQDGICEYGSTDGSLVAAKWESGMDNAIRFDDAKILKNSEGAYSLNQESVDLNAYLYAEKLYLAQLATALSKNDEATQFLNEAASLKTRIQEQFYDPIDGWFYDTSIDGKTFIKGAGSEGWTALWANAASQEQAIKVVAHMMGPNKFFTKVPFQTMSANHEKFDPLKGYWRGPNWLDQAYFGVRGLKNYGYNQEAQQATIQILKGAEGILDKGAPIRENYHPLTGEGLHAKNFSWSAAHIIMLLLED